MIQYLLFLFLYQGFGVTPALLSTYGSLLTIGMIERSLSARLIQQRQQQRYDQCTAAAEGTILDAVSTDDSMSNDDDGAATSDSYHLSCENDRQNLTNAGSAQGQGLVEEMQDVESAWLDRFGEQGNVWSEYTLYRLALGMYAPVPYLAMTPVA